MNRRALRCFAFIMLAAGGAWPAAAQIQSGSVLVKVADDQGGVLPGVTCTISGPTLFAPATGTTDSGGAYRFPSLAPGVYTLKLELASFRTLERRDVVVHVGQTTPLELTLQVAGVAESLIVQGSSPTVDTTSTNVNTLIDQSVLQSTPGGRDIWSLLEYKASGLTTDRVDVGGSEEGLQAGFVVHGTPHGQNTQALNGVNVSDQVATGFADFYYDYDTLQEVQVSTGAHSVEVGTPGVYLNMVTKTGTDQTRGQVAYYFQNHSTQSDNIDQALRDQGIQKAGFDYLSDFTAQLGGPILRNKLRYFGAWRDWRVHRFVTGFVDASNTPIVEPTDMYSFLGNVSYQASPNHRFTGFWTRQYYKKPQRGASALNTPVSNWREDDRFDIVQGLWNGVLSSRAFVDARLSYVDIYFPLFIKDEAVAAGNQSVTDLATGRVTGAATQQFISIRKRVQANAGLSYYKDDWLGARHEFRVGWDFANSPNSSLTSALGDVNLFVTDGVPNYVSEFNTPVDEHETFRSNALFASDSVQFRRLTVNGGLRYERVQGIVPDQSSPAGAFTPARTFSSLGSIVDWNSVSPRVGVIYQLTGDGKTVAKANAARYYYQISTVVPGSANPNGLSGRNVQWTDPNGDGRFQLNEAGAVLGTFGGVVTSVDANLKPSFTDEFVAGVEREVLPDFRLSGLFTYRRERRQVGLQNITSVFIPTVVPNPLGGTLTVFNESPESVGNERFLVTNSDRLNQRFHGFEVLANKRLSHRWQLLGSLSISRAIQEQVLTGNDIYASFAVPSVDPNNGVNARGPITWDRLLVGKIAASYMLPYDVVLSGNLRSQSGPVFTPTTVVNLNQGAVTVFAEPRDQSNRLKALNTVDLRASKAFRFGARRVEAMVDAYNIFNSNTILDANAHLGPAFESPLTVLPPRIVRVGARLIF